MSPRRRASPTRKSPKRNARKRSSPRKAAKELEGGAWWCPKIIPFCKAAAEKKAADWTAARELYKKLDSEIESDPFLARYRVWVEFQSYSTQNLLKTYFLASGAEADLLARQAQLSCQREVAKPTKADVDQCIASTAKLQEWISETLKGKAAWLENPDTEAIRAWIREQRNDKYFDFGYQPKVISSPT